MSTPTRPPVSRCAARLGLALVVGALIWAVGQHFLLRADSHRSFGHDFIEGLVFMLIVILLPPLVTRLFGMWKAWRSRSGP